MNILFYLHQFPGFGGMETIAATLAKELVRRGHDVSFLSHRAGTGTSVMTALPEQVRCYKMPDAGHLVSSENRRFMKEVVSRNRIEAVLFRDSYAPIERNVLDCGVSVKVITSEHNSPFFCHEAAHPEAFSLRRRTIDALRYGRFRSPTFYEGRRKRFLYDNSDLYVLLSDRFYGEFKAMAHLFDSRKLRAINNPLAPELVPSQIDLAAKEKLVVFAATLSVEKGAMRALIALNKLKADGMLPLGWRFLVLGDGPERARCEAYVRERKLDFVEFRGYENNPQPFFSRAKVLLFPSSREGFGNVLFEAQANGCVPIAFSSYSSVFDIVHHGSDGLLVDAFDIDKYASAIRSLLVDEVRWQAMAQKATEVTRRFDVKQVVDKWEGLLEEVLA